MNRRSSENEYVVEIRRRAGSLREIRTSRERRFLVVNDPATKRFLEVGAALGEHDVMELTGRLARSAGLELAYRMLARRSRSEWEIRKALATEGIGDAGVVDEIVETLRRQGYIDDRRFAEGFVRYVMQHRPSGPYVLRKRLRDVGVSEDIIDLEVKNAFALATEKTVALKLAARRIDTTISRERAVRRMHGFLTRRGFSNGVVSDVCAMILRGEIAGEDG